MLNLGRRVSYLFWQHPILWLPLLCVDLAAYWLHRLQRLASYQLLVWLLPHESVFSHNPAPLTPGSSLVRNAWWISTPIFWGNSLLCLCLYVAAFMVTAYLVQQLLCETAPNLSLSVQFVQFRLRKLFLFSISIFLLFPVAGFLSTTPYLNRSFFLFPLSSLIQIEILGVIMSAAIGFLLAPLALKLIQPPQSEPIPRAAKMQARIFAALAVVATVILGFTLPAIERNFYNDFSAHWQILDPLLSIIGSLIATFPYIALSIALSLLATSEPQDFPTIVEASAETE